MALVPGPLFDGNEIYLARRTAAWRLVRERLQECGIPTEAVRGSWRHGDFHLDLQGRISFSDLDLVLPGTTDQERSSLRQVIEQRLATSMVIPVSIHPLDSMRGLTIEDARLLLIGEYLSSILRKATSGRMTADYARAKITLLFLRNAPDERYQQVAERLQDRRVMLAAKVKLGVTALFPPAEMRRCLEAEPDSSIQRFVSGCLLREPTGDFVRQWEEDVRVAPSVTEWLKEFLIARSLQCVPS